ncbi:Oidioi.mRNA.OKI2018_I69.chr1.g208.t1.cds [Oikopleura dioica]|uniref:Oidioi.mRNA.OKI2018_I69.chr1.g208.t1.cds n=1 Tax=Oikopleura dioica TaxID=34765 RepID=A0ABN7SJ50_OIKDI|nr:Oidioi.mRNA.OKI2018_I69.chr1.g208.t1.cds [Oikopleura dioica]
MIPGWKLLNYQFLIALALCMYILPVAAELFLCACLWITSRRQQSKCKIRGQRSVRSRDWMSPAGYGNVNSSIFGTPHGPVDNEDASRTSSKKPKHLKLQETIVKYAYLDTIIYSFLWGPWYLTMLFVIRIESSKSVLYVGQNLQHQGRIMHFIIYIALIFVYIYFVIWPLRCVRMADPDSRKPQQRDYSKILRSDRTEELPRRERRNAFIDAAISRSNQITNLTSALSDETLCANEEQEDNVKTYININTLAV